MSSEFYFFLIKKVRPITVLDSIKISGALIDNLIKLFPEETEKILNSFKNGNTAVSSPLPYREKILFPTLAFDIYILENTTRDGFLEMMKLRKHIKRFLTIEELKSLFRSRNNLSIPLNEFPHYGEKDGEVETIGLGNKEEPGLNIMDERFFIKEYEEGSDFDLLNETYSRGLWFGIKSDLEKEHILSAISLMTDFGLSGRFSTGKGQVIIKELNVDAEYFKYSGEGFYMNLSSFIPNKNDVNYIDLKNSLYRLGAISGYTYNGEPLGIYRYFRSGSIFKLSNEINGITFNVNDKRVLSFNAFLLKVM